MNEIRSENFEHQITNRDSTDRVRPLGINGGDFLTELRLNKTTDNIDGRTIHNSLDGVTIKLIKPTNTQDTRTAVYLAGEEGKARWILEMAGKVFNTPDEAKRFVEQTALDNVEHS